MKWCKGNLLFIDSGKLDLVEFPPMNSIKVFTYLIKRGLLPLFIPLNLNFAVNLGAFSISGHFPTSV